MTDLSKESYLWCEALLHLKAASSEAFRWYSSDRKSNWQKVVPQNCSKWMTHSTCWLYTTDVHISLLVVAYTHPCCIPIWMLNDPIGSVRSTGYYLNVPTCYMQTPLSLCLLLAYPFRFSMGPFASDVYCTVDGQLVFTVAQTDRKLCTTRIVESTYWMPNSTCCLQTHCHWMLSWMSTD